MSYELLYEWQTLIGAFLGAATPISLLFLTEWYKKRKEHKEHLYRLEKFLVYCINDTIDSSLTIKKFVDDRLTELIDNINERTKNGIYSVDAAFFPLTSRHSIDEAFFDVDTGSGYLDNKLLQVLKTSKDFATAIDDARQQFTNTIQVNRDMSFGKLNPAKIQNEAYKTNIQDFMKMMKRDLTDNNTKIYMRILLSARVELNALRDIGVIRWRLKFEAHFKYFRNRQDLKRYFDNTYERIDKFFEKEIDTEFKKMESLYK